MSRPSPYPSMQVGQEEATDAQNFATALRPAPHGLHTLAHFCPAVTPHSGCLDTLLFRNVLLVAYAACDEVVIALGTDLHALRRLRHPSSEEPVTALAFRGTDGAIAAAFGQEIVVFEGWSTAARERGTVYDTSATEAVLNTTEHGISDPIVSLSWSGSGNELCAVANAIVVWSLDSSYLPIRCTVHATIPQKSIPMHPLELASISPEGQHIAVAGLYARIAYVYTIAAKSRPAEIVHGRSGVAVLDWKKRGGGNPALMTSDRDGTMRIWVRAAASTTVEKYPQTWIEEIARSPHAEDTPRAGAAFLEWGGGGGVADNEGDARATNAAHPLLAEGTAPKPSRCYHWLIRVAGGNATAWRVRGLDDRPRAEYARLEPGNIESLVGSLDDDDFRPPEQPLNDVAVAAMKAVAPIPLTTASQYKVGLVKSYAVSNGERRLRSPEPPEPPNVVAIFLLAVRHGLPFLARYDICPTSNMPAVCRARVGVGHTSPVVDLVASMQASANVLGSGGWLASRGSSGDVLLWRTNVSTGAWEPISAVAALRGPHSAVAFAPPMTASHNRWEIGVFSCDAAHGSLRLFQFVNVLRRNENASAQDVQFAKQVATCQLRRPGNVDPVVQLVAMPVGKNLDHATGLTCAIFGMRTSGRMSAWRACRWMKDKLSLEPSVIRVLGRRPETITHIASNDLASAGKQIFVTGGKDGSAYVYVVAESELETDINKIDEMGDSEDEDTDEGVIWLRQLCHLHNPCKSDGAVEKIEVLQGGSRILVMHQSGKVSVWSRNVFEGSEWHLELTHSEDSSSDTGLSNDEVRSKDSNASIGFDVEGNCAAVVLRKNGSFARYKRALGMPWELVQSNESPQDGVPVQRHAVVHIGKGVVVASNGRGMSVFAGSKSDSHSLSFSSDAAGFYDPSKSFFALLLTGGRAWQIVSALSELHNFVRNVAKRKASETSYGAGRGVIAPAPSLSMLTSESKEPPKEFQSNDSPADTVNHATNPFNLTGSSGSSIFAELMRKSDARFANGNAIEEEDNDESENEKGPDLSVLAKRLRVVQLGGLSRSQQSVLAAVARACASLKTILTSLDESGARYALMASCYRELSKQEAVPLPCVISAVHSSSSDALLDHFLPPVAPGMRPTNGYTRMWETARSLGVGWWVNTSSGCQKLAERMARSDFNATKKADYAALWYVVLGKRKALSAFYRAEQNSRMSQFLLRNFDHEENRTAAGKNAYVLVSKHRLELAVAFFVLANDIKGALNLVRTRIKDDQLALFLARILANGEHVQQLLESIIDSSQQSGDDHRRSLALWLSGKHELALQQAGAARYPSPGTNLSDTERAISGSLPSVVHSLAHVLAMSERPPIRGTEKARSIVQQCRRKAIRALLGDGSPVAALVVSFQVMRAEGIDGESEPIKPYSRRNADTTNGSVLSAAVDSLRGRAVCHAGAVRSGATEETLQQLLFKDLLDLRLSPMGLERCVTAVEGATFELVKEDEIDAALAMTDACTEVLEKESNIDRKLKRRMHAAQRNSLRVAVSRGLFHMQGALSLLHHPTFSSNRLAELLGKYKAAMNQIDRASSSRSEMFTLLCAEFRGAVLSLRFALAFLRGDWPTIWFTLRACEVPWHRKVSQSIEDLGGDKDCDDCFSMTSSGCSSLAPDSVSLEALRHVASNPAVLRISKSLGHIRRFRKTPSIALVGESIGAVSLTDDSMGKPTLSVGADDPYAVIRMHPALSSTLAAASAAFLATHLATHAAYFGKCMFEEGKQRHRSSHEFWQTDSGDRYDQSFRLIKAAETLEQLAEDAISRWVPLQRFGADANISSVAQLDDSAGAFVDLWSTLGCMPEYAPSLSEAATVAAAEMAAAGARAAVEAAEQKDGGRRRRRRRERRGEVVASVEKEGLKLFDTTSADSLYGAYPVRFSSSAQGPWSGKGGHASLYSEERALFRTLCISSTDPPAVIVATPKGVQEIVPSSYTTMPAGFRSHYSSKKNASRRSEDDARLQALAKDRDEEFEQEQEDDQDDGFLSSYDGFGEGPYVPLKLSQDRDSERRSKYLSARDRKAVWRHQVQATTLAAHPLRRRFASGGTDGVVRLWDYADPISLASFREKHTGRVADLRFSAYGSEMLAVYSSGQVTIWDDPDTYSTHPRSKDSDSRAKTIHAFDKRVAFGGAFLDERHTVAIVGDPTAPPCVGHSLRIFDTREPHSSFHASWSAAVNHQFEARCLTLLEDRMRLVTGGLDGSLSIVDIRTKACIAELPAHADEVTCLALEMPRGRALVSGSANGEIKLWDSRTLLQLDHIQEAHTPTRHYWSGNGIGGLVGSYGTQGLALTDRSLISCGGDGVVKIWGPGWSDFDLNVL